MAIKIVSKIEDNEVKSAFPDAYLKVHDVEIRTSKNEAWIRILVFANKNARDLDACSIKKVTKKVSLDDLSLESFDKSSILSASYEWIKLQPEFSGIDV